MVIPGDSAAGIVCGVIFTSLRFRGGLRRAIDAATECWWGRETRVGQHRFSHGRWCHTEFVVISGTLNFLALYNALITARILLSWFPQAQGQPLLQPLFVVTDPFLNLFRGLGLNFGGLDFSILPAFFLLNALTNAVPALGADASFLVDPSALM